MKMNVFLMSTQRIFNSGHQLEYLGPGWKMRQWSFASSQNFLLDSWITAKARFLHRLRNQAEKVCVFSKTSLLECALLAFLISPVKRVLGWFAAL